LEKYFRALERAALSVEAVREKARPEACLNGYAGAGYIYSSASMQPTAPRPGAGYPPWLNLRLKGVAAPAMAGRRN